MTTLTIFTPTYNRADTLPRVYESLRKQTSKAFVWLIIDDGSTDRTRQLVQGWAASAPFPIRYRHQPNAGKHNAHNRAIAEADTELFLILDADDELLPNAVQVISAEWESLTQAEQDSLAGIWTLCVTPDGAACGEPFPQDRLDASLQALRYQYRSVGERLPCFRTRVLREYPFPSTEAGACSYIPEAYVWSAITRRYKLRCLNVACRIYHPGPGLSEMSRHEYQVSRAIVYAYVQPLANDLAWFLHEPASFIFNAAQTVRYGLFSRSLKRAYREVGWPARILLILAFPLGLALLARDYLSGRIAKQLAAEQAVRPYVTQRPQ